MDESNGGDPVAIVRDGYDAVAERYTSWGPAVASSVRDERLGRLLELLGPMAPATVLELGCGQGGTAAKLVAAGHSVTGIDVSAAQLAVARRDVPGAEFREANYLELDLPADSFDAVVAFYSFNHVPREQLPSLLARMASWLRPHGLLFATFGATDDPGTIEPDWLGAPMFFSHFDAATNERLVREAGFDDVVGRLIDEPEPDGPVPFLWVEARQRSKKRSSASIAPSAISSSAQE